MYGVRHVPKALHSSPYYLVMESKWNWWEYIKASIISWSSTARINITIRRKKWILGFQCLDAQTMKISSSPFEMKRNVIWYWAVSVRLFQFSAQYWTPISNPIVIEDSWALINDLCDGWWFLNRIDSQFGISCISNVMPYRWQMVRQEKKVKKKTIFSICSLVWNRLSEAEKPLKRMTSE